MHRTVAAVEQKHNKATVENTSSTVTPLNRQL